MATLLLELVTYDFTVTVASPLNIGFNGGEAVSGEFNYTPEPAQIDCDCSFTETYPAAAGWFQDASGQPVLVAPLDSGNVDNNGGYGVVESAKTYDNGSPPTFIEIGAAHNSQTDYGLVPFR